jgi:hypothetical protein
MLPQVLSDLVEDLARLVQVEELAKHLNLDEW